MYQADVAGGKEGIAVLAASHCGVHSIALVLNAGVGSGL